jgi:hypothetical protein
MTRIATYVHTQRMPITHRVGEFLVRNSPQRYCDDCLARTLPLRNVGQAKRATKALASGPGYLQEEAECSRCGATKHTTRALWADL